MRFPTTLIVACLSLLPSLSSACLHLRASFIAEANHSPRVSIYADDNGISTCVGSDQGFAGSIYCRDSSVRLTYDWGNGPVRSDLFITYATGHGTFRVSNGREPRNDRWHFCSGKARREGSERKRSRIERRAGGEVVIIDMQEKVLIQNGTVTGVGWKYSPYKNDTVSGADVTELKS